MRRRPPRLCAAGRRRDRLRGARLDQRRRLRHRLRQHGGALNLKYEDIKDRVPVDRQRHRQAESASGSAAATRSRSTMRCSTARCGSDAGVGHLKQMARDAARHRRLRQPLCRPVRGRGRATSGSACTSARAASATRRATALHQARPAARTASTSRRPSLHGRQRARPALPRRHDARRPVRLCRPRVGGGEGALDHRRRGARQRAQPPQLRLARAPRRA